MQPSGSYDQDRGRQQQCLWRNTSKRLNVLAEEDCQPCEEEDEIIGTGEDLFHFVIVVARRSRSDDLAAMGALGILVRPNV